MKSFSSCLLVLILLGSSVFAPAASKSDLTTSGGQGISARISDYSLINGQFCFTITNTSVSQVGIVAIGFPSETTTSLNPASFSYAGAGSFFFSTYEFFEDESTGQEFAPSFAIVARYVLPPHMSTTFCVTGDFMGLTAQQVAQSLVVLFGQNPRPIGSDFLTCQGSASGQLASNNLALINITSLSSSLFCFRVDNIGTSALTGIGVDANGAQEPFFGFFPPSQPYNQNFKFTTSPGPVPQFNATELNFALVTGNDFAGGNVRKGIQPSDTSAEFCVLGDFSYIIIPESLDPDKNTIDVNRIFARFPDGTAPCSPGNGGAGGGSLEGVLGGRPQ